MIIDNVKIYTEAGTFVSGGIITQGDKITEIYTEAEKEKVGGSKAFCFRSFSVTICPEVWISGL